jgi:aryl-alcohol dehydrogenase (NADP+)
MAQFDDLLAGAGLKLGDDLLDRIDGIVPPGTDAGINEAMYQPPSMLKPELRRRPAAERAAI